jgi:cell division protein FtsZ
MISRRTFLAASAATAALGGASLSVGPTHLPGRRIRVFGVGGGGMNALRDIQPLVAGLADVVALNTDAQDLHKTAAPYKHQLGATLTKGLGAGGNPELGRQAALGDEDILYRLINGAGVVLLVAGLGGGTGTGALPVLADRARQVNARAIAVVSLPFWFEGRRRLARAQEGLEAIIEAADVVIALPNQALVAGATRHATMRTAFQQADQTAALVTDAMRVAAMLSEQRVLRPLRGRGLGGAGVGDGADPLSAVASALTSPMMEDLSVIPNEVLVHLRGLSPSDQEVPVLKSLVRERLGGVRVVFAQSAGDESGCLATVVALGQDRLGLRV